MQIQLQQLVPVPLRDKLEQRKSDIWNTSVTFNKGEWVKIKAPSGTGKTTLVHTLYKLRDDYEGAVSWGGKSLRNYRPAETAALRQQTVSIIFQDMRLFPNLTARENIELKRVLTAPPYYEATVIDAMAEKLQVAHVLNQRAGLCSYGEQQRIAIIRALVQPFEWLVMDEPFSHLDHNNAGKAAELIATECTKRKAGFILTDLDEDTHFAYTRNLLL
ncbi:ATP-binding cassette domain-containing protein [Deminuibacter soli]|uniref:ATP-binding cassette domain-containing protein n=1 Tax=Deminuibacter soli TaxID=2291815 RepID=A0A3E1NFY7_9BACT|nr:ATP-binding cassette domain-containing protein [Deminuibacter soli]RFM26731.1 ATP-binding cassette domain-containing protein [Deminuibacter soli]